MNLGNSIILVEDYCKMFLRCCQSKRFIAYEEVQEGQESQAPQVDYLVIFKLTHCRTAIIERKAPGKNMAG